MLRLFVLILLLANGLFFVWSQGLLKAYGWGPAPQNEPHRLTQQIHPEKLRLLTAEDLRRLEADPAQAAVPATATPASAPVSAPAAAPALPPASAASAPITAPAAAASAAPAAQVAAAPASAAASAARPLECLQAGLFDERQAAVLRQALASTLPQVNWKLESGMEPARWIVYMGRYADAEAVNKKRLQLRSLNIRFEPLTNPALAPGLSLGGYPTEAAATEALSELSGRGVRTARVLQERPEMHGQWLKVPQADAALKERLATYKTALASKPLRPCR
jgi:hypothetical protein